MISGLNQSNWINFLKYTKSNVIDLDKNEQVKTNIEANPKQDHQISMGNLERLIRFRYGKKIIRSQNQAFSGDSSPKVINQQVDYAAVDRWLKKRERNDIRKKKILVFEQLLEHKEVARSEFQKR